MGTAEKLKNTPLLRLANRALEKKAAGRGAKDILKDIGSKLKSDHRFWTTPAGAATGLLLSRQLVPEEDRNLFNQGAGTAAGAGVGYAAGSLLNANKPVSEDDFHNTLSTSTAPPTEAMLKDMVSRGHDPKIPGISKQEGMDPTSYTAQKARTIQPMYTELMWYRLQMQASKKRGNKEVYDYAQSQSQIIEDRIKNAGFGAMINALVNKASRKYNEL